MQLATDLRMKMTQKLPYLIPFLFPLAMSSKVFFDYNKIATYREIGMDCRVSDPEERSSIQIHHGNIEKVTMTTGCIMKSNDSRLSISCKETEDSILLSINMTGYNSSDLGTWNCSDGKSYDTVTFQYFIQRAPFIREQLNATFRCILYEDCYLSLPVNWGPIFEHFILRRIDGTAVLLLVLRNVLISDAYRGRINLTDNYAYPFLNFTFLEMKFSDAGIYYILADDIFLSVAFIIQVQDYPTQPVISAQNLSSNSDQILFELMCSSESRTQPVFSRSLRSYHWKFNGLDLNDLHSCFSRRGPVLTLCRESCRLEVNVNISVTCTAEEDGLMSNESEPFIIRLVTPLVPAKHLVNTTSVSVSVEYKDQIGGHSTGTLIGICVGCLVAGSVLSVFLTLLIIRRSVLCQKDHVGKRNYGQSNEAFYVNTNVDNGSRTTEIETTRQYEVLDQNRMEYPKSQYAVIQLKGSGHQNEAEMYEIA